LLNSFEDEAIRNPSADYTVTAAYSLMPLLTFESTRPIQHSVPIGGLVHAGIGGQRNLSYLHLHREALSLFSSSFTWPTDCRNEELWIPA
jgi:hypothetical protein